ncbi:methionyl-tRNA formyltransferase [Olivibacter domesticus]|uniref:Methionyl-tRNA formyltransferase n=1 Tax=Olivibacter domesticus TaxID=407022 RepID=A0A1H7IME3_OLID1|nr:methionyl-tRNA formyltransferase [Olivibacter domesticus]SEK63494.1 methionyl-tRNA formyltransferase [Olivibacter domesticus]
MRIIFMGTPDFAVASLQALLEAGENVVAVVTVADKPAGRGQKIQESAVKKFAVSNNIPVLQPVKLKDEHFLAALKSFNADLQVVVAFRMLPEVVWNMPPKGTINLHASLLPQYRGAAPINHAIINGEKESGVTTFLLQHQIDTGNILFKETVSIAATDTAGDLHDKLMAVGAQLLIKTVGAIKNGKHQEIPQEEIINNVELKHAPKIFKEDCKIIWDKPLQEVYNLIRGLSPYPTAFTDFQGKILKIFKCTPLKDTTNEQPGSFISDGKHYLRFAAKGGYIDVTEVQLEGKRRMSVEEFLRGVRI